MAGVDAPSVSNTMSLRCGHEETRAPVVLGGTADVICVGAVLGPTRADGGVFVNKALCSEGRDGCLVYKKSVDLFVG